MNIEETLAKMSLEDKVALCSGADFWTTKAFAKYDIPSLFMCDGPHGLRKQENKADMLGVNKSRQAVCFPAEVTTAQSFDPALLQKIGSAIGQEAEQQDVDMVLGPGVNIKRNPLCGRNFEYFSEDPILAGKLAAGFIRGIEAEGISCSLKHFAANSQEYCRFNSNSVLDERTLREIYLKAFEIAVKQGHPSTLMCAYPKLNGIHCSDNKWLLTDVLRKEWGFDGAVVTDWGAMNDRIKGFEAGCDLNMPGGSAYMEKQVIQAVKDGRLEEECINDSVRRILKLIDRAEKTRKSKQKQDWEKMAETHHLLAEKAAEEGIVLLKNENVLPLQENEKIALVGSFAKQMRYQGAGSSHINAFHMDQPADFFKDALYAEGFDEDGSTDEAMLKEAEKIGKQADKVIIFAGLPGKYESEGFDRADLKLPDGENTLIDRMIQTGRDVIVVLISGSVVECPWSDKVQGILYGGLPGEAGAAAIANVLKGISNPSGRLAETWPYTYSDCVSSSYYGKTKDAIYLEGEYVGYRYYDKAGVPVRWPFGYGLSYTQFAYSNLKAEGRKVSCTIRNTGSRAGDEIVQLYVGQTHPALHRPIKELKHFTRIHLEAGQEKEVSFVLEDDDFALWDDGWKVPDGSYAVYVGRNSQDLPLQTEIEICDRDEVSAPEWQKGSWYESCQGKVRLSAFEKMSGIHYVEDHPHKGTYTMDNTVMEMKQDAWIMKIMYKAVEKTIAKGFGGKADYDNPEFRMLMASSAGSPLRAMMISGGMDNNVLPGMLEMANGHFFKGLFKMMEKNR
ncbi:MAG: glycoside hydrolase family 3 C-terminal domain-containing protein [Lactimicrobium sp.]|jgi:beta-glucosidase|uniref:glycoside hydrolase family 3 C-terminal domain-containing protein n=1 Tax=Lactimicrobium sp. TaxID=2563780 RepID=UPI002F353955